MEVVWSRECVFMSSLSISMESEAKYYYLATPLNVLKCPLSNSTGLSQLMYVCSRKDVHLNFTPHNLDWNIPG